MLLAAAVIILSAIATFLVFLWVRSRARSAPSNQGGSLLPQVGLTVPGQFVHGANHIRVFFEVEERKGSRLMLHILSELGTTSVAGINSGTAGQLDVGEYYFPIKVVKASFPWVEVEALSEQAKPVRRESVRIPVSFSVRIRLLGSAGRWEVGKGINISDRGICFLSNSTAPPQTRRYYEIEMAFTDSRTSGEKFACAMEGRWVQRVKGGAMVGMQVIEAAKRKDMAQLVSRVQHRIVRRPDNYVSETKPKPTLK